MCMHQVRVFPVAPGNRDLVCAIRKHIDYHSLDQSIPALVGHHMGYRISHLSPRPQVGAARRRRASADQSTCSSRVLNLSPARYHYGYGRSWGDEDRASAGKFMSEPVVWTSGEEAADKAAADEAAADRARDNRPASWWGSHSWLEREFRSPDRQSFQGRQQARTLQRVDFFRLRGGARGDPHLPSSFKLLAKDRY